jgi:hypothetical protein
MGRSKSSSIWTSSKKNENDEDDENLFKGGDLDESRSSHNPKGSVVDRFKSVFRLSNAGLPSEANLVDPKTPEMKKEVDSDEDHKIF